jgi:hypothetical protein
VPSLAPHLAPCAWLRSCPAGIDQHAMSRSRSRLGWDTRCCTQFQQLCCPTCLAFWLWRAVYKRGNGSSGAVRGQVQLMTRSDRLQCA